ncbi:MAG: ribosome biosis GTPase / thiamine phosphate phosphatase, partial [Clostridiales bacterium]|nr:ribosome biosis GTPase / thiamine phosphate phosphatase [Clostridiales bacterium]
SGAKPVIILTKADLAEEVEQKIEMVCQIARGAKVCPVSAVTGEGMERLNEYLQPEKTIVFLGSSGVGKSTLTNYLLGEEVVETGGIRENDSKGHHTTTHRQLFILQNGARIIDTPGMRELGVWVVEEGMESGFADIVELAKQCKFNNCTHTKEQGCAILDALQEGALSLPRWNNYRKLLRESKFQQEKENRSKKSERKLHNRKTKKSAHSKGQIQKEEWEKEWYGN